MPSSTISAYALRFPGLLGSTRRSLTVTVGLFKFLYLYPNQSSQKGKPPLEVQVPREAFSSRAAGSNTAQANPYSYEIRKGWKGNREKL
jgi:hypothetical protein